MFYNYLVLLLFCVTLHKHAESLETNKQKVETKTMIFLNSASRNIGNTAKQHTGTLEQKSRVKREESSGAGKFTEAAKTSQTKVLRLFLQFFSNTWADSHVGGTNPFHASVPKRTVFLIKQRILEFLFPKVGEDRKVTEK